MILGFTYSGKHTNEFEKLRIRTISNPILPEKRIITQYVMGRDSSYNFEDGYNDRFLEFECTLIERDLFKRREIIREIADWLNSDGELILDYDEDKKYIVTKTINNIDLDLLNGRDVFTIAFVCKPQIYSNYANNIVTWQNVSNNSKFDVYNKGTFKKTLPVIELVGTATSITLQCNSKQFTYSNLSGTIIIDCENEVVYEGNKVNKMQNFDGDFLEFAKGFNTVNATGNISDLTINFKFDYAYI